MASSVEEYRSGFVGIVGMPNAGKSTLVNCVLQQKLSIISSKPQTTRNRVLGIFSTDDMQVALIDTPGIHRPSGRLHRVMVKSAEQVIPDMDVVTWVIDAVPQVQKLAKGKELFNGGILHISKLLADVPQLIVVFNKVDKLPKEKLFPLLLRFQQQFPNGHMVPLSALKNDNVEALLRVWKKVLPIAPPMFPKDQFTDVTERFLVSEMIREKVFQLTNQEIPYSVAVEVEKFIEQPKSIKIYARIWVEKKSQKGIVIGHQGSLLKKIGTSARRDIEQMLGTKVWLDIHVSIKDKWTDNPVSLKELGYE